jgi:small GTP-binding protein
VLLSHFLLVLCRVEDIFAKVLEVDGKSRALEIIDTAGQEEYKTLRDIYFKDSDGFVLVYSITSPQSFVQAQKLKDRLTQIHGPGKPIILAGNKLDLEGDREVAEDEAYQYAVSQQVGFFECSAKVRLYFYCNCDCKMMIVIVNSILILKFATKGVYQCD